MKSSDAAAAGAAGRQDHTRMTQNATRPDGRHRAFMAVLPKPSVVLDLHVWRCTQPTALPRCLLPEDSPWLEMKVQAYGNHMAIVVELLIRNILVLRLDFFKPDIAVGAVDRPMMIQEELQAAAGVQTEPVLSIVKSARPFYG